MRRAGLEGASRRKKAWTTKRDRDARPAPDLVERDFSSEGPDRLWVADITYIPTWSGFTLDPASVAEDVHPLSIHSVGRYAIQINWSDSHSTGIYPYRRLRALAEGPC